MGAPASMRTLVLLLSSGGVWGEKRLYNQHQRYGDTSGYGGTESADRKSVDDKGDLRQPWFNAGAGGPDGITGWSKLSKDDTAFDMKVQATCNSATVNLADSDSITPTNPTAVYSLSSYPKSITTSQDAVSSIVLSRTYKIASANTRQTTVTVQVKNTGTTDCTALKVWFGMQDDGIGGQDKLTCKAAAVTANCNAYAPGPACGTGTDVTGTYTCKAAAVTANCDAIAPGPACGTGAETGNGAGNECQSVANQYDVVGSSACASLAAQYDTSIDGTNDNTLTKTLGTCTGGCESGFAAGATHSVVKIGAPTTTGDTADVYLSQTSATAGGTGTATALVTTVPNFLGATSSQGLTNNAVTDTTNGVGVYYSWTTGGAADNIKANGGIREVTFTFESYTNKVYSHISPSPPPPSFPPSFPPSIPPGPSSPPPPPKPPPSPWYQAKTCDEMCNWSQLQTPPLNSVNQLCVKQQWLMDPYAEVRTPGEFNSHDCKLPAIGAAQTCPSSYFICTGNKFYSAPSPPPAGTPSCPEDEETIKKCGACSNQDDCGKSEYCLKKVAKNKCKKKKVQKKCGYTCRAEIARRETEKAQRKAARAARRAQKAAEKAAKKAAKQG